MLDFKLIHGIYETVITHALEERLSRISDSFDEEKISSIPIPTVVCEMRIYHNERETA